MRGVPSLCRFICLKKYQAKSSAINAAVGINQKIVGVFPISSFF
jgi:hypothetical protein